MVRTMLIVTAVLGCWMPVAGRAAEKAVAGKRASYVHTVIFYLKKDLPEGEAEAVITDAQSLLTKIPSVRLLKIGPPAEKSTPEFAQKDYQVGLLVLFDDFDGLQQYLNHPNHKEYVAKHQKSMEKIVVYDFVNQQPK